MTKTSTSQCESPSSRRTGVFIRPGGPRDYWLSWAKTPLQPHGVTARPVGAFKKGKCVQTKIQSIRLGSKNPAAEKRKELSVQMWSRARLLFIFVVFFSFIGVDSVSWWFLPASLWLFFFFFPRHKGSWVRKKTPRCSHSVYTRKAWPGIRTGSRPLSATVSARNFSAFRDTCSHAVESTDKC